MNSRNMAQALFEDAKDRVSEAEEHFAKGKYHRVVRLSAECVELAIRAFLYYAGEDFPKEHDLGKFFDRIPLVRQELSVPDRRRVRKINKDLSTERSMSFYGDPGGTPPSQIYSSADAREAIDGSKYVVETISRITRVRLRPISSTWIHIDSVINELFQVKI